MQYASAYLHADCLGLLITFVPTEKHTDFFLKKKPAKFFSLVDGGRFREARANQG